MKHPFLTSYWTQAMSYTSYNALVQEMAETGKSTGPNQGEDMVHYTRLNAKRMKRLNKTTHLSPALQELLDGLKKSYQWLVLTESWCGDAAQIIPLLGTIENASAGKIDLRLILRDENPELMDRYLTRGGRSIPKIIAVDAETGEEVGSWGPRPEAAQVLVDAYKAEPGDRTFADFAAELQQWYNKDKGLSTEAELIEAVEGWEAG